MTTRLLTICGALVLLGCGDSDGGGHGDTTPGGDQQGESPEETGDACEGPSDCFQDLKGDAGVIGDVVCMDRVEGGYCTHHCTNDDDCCAVEGECQTDLPQVCSPFESTDDMFCFLSCEEEDIVDVPDGGLASLDGGSDDEATRFCQFYANREFICRSSGGGNKNRKVCVPGGK